jgi:hypothetical protein
MQMNSIPIYCGDPYIGDVFNQKSFVNALQYMPVKNGGLKRFFEKKSQYNFNDYRPAIHSGLYHKVRRKLKTIGKNQKMKLQLNKLDFTPLIERIIELDQNPELYKAMLQEPWFKNNEILAHLPSANRWREIFNSKPAR